jgi:hypothetical protein
MLSCCNLCIHSAELSLIRTLGAALRLAGYGLAPTQLQAWMREVEHKLVLPPVGRRHLPRSGVQQSAI